MTFKRKSAPVVALATVALALTACAQSDRDTDTATGSGTGAASGGTFTFGAAGAPSGFDPLYATDGETFRVTRQIFEGLVGIKPGTADMQPLLAESWEPSTDGKTWTFKLKSGVKFSDGEAFNGEAVCYNFERMFDQNTSGQGVATYWADTMGAFKDKAAESLYAGCEAPDEGTAVLKLTRATSKFPVMLSLESFSMQSPKALKDGDANGVTGQGAGLKYPAYTSAPVGTGAYTLEKYDEANKTVSLARNDSYWGEKAKTAKIVFKILPDESTRRQELTAGSIDAYDLPNPSDWKGLKDSGNKVEVRPAFNILYMGLNPEKNPKLKDLRVRQAIYMAINRDQLVQTQLPEGATVATQFMPDTLSGYNKSLKPVAYDATRAKALLKDAGAEGMTLEFAYPSEVSRPYMPNPQRIHDAIKANLEAAGIKVKVVTAPWVEYLDNVDPGFKYDSWLVGWTGDYNSADNFIGVFFTKQENSFRTYAAGYGAKLSADLKAADGIVDEAERTAAYEKLNQQIMEEYLPGLPISHSPPALTTSPKVSGLTVSPLTAEEFSTVTVGGN